MWDLEDAFAAAIDKKYYTLADRIWKLDIDAISEKEVHVLLRLACQDGSTNAIKYLYLIRQILEERQMDEYYM
ncbi:uncharacterized protein PITG_22489 [Phytophthora infestans T30-4]|uniref:Uncharacterized protein n=1 Tax=Phytophthora infestans (strain T30-4) TaxID=403677 RepID=D0RME4_PHYIT|nr:uncharacterized protein PITG_22489 [Phytophthora infestans T30-4]EEY62753.1 hypothetical protein PITG_22489 [Phytophthora infestans T30-4]|eukprot:XP_002909786.1 hypothetical protein PITG_22489 [Phytophthora infestans T30-4]